MLTQKHKKNIKKALSKEDSITYCTHWDLTKEDLEWLKKNNIKVIYSETELGPFLGDRPWMTKITILRKK